MKNIFKNKVPELTAGDRMAMIADLDAESREHERIEYEFAKEKLGGLATSQDVELQSKEASSEE